MNTPLRDRIQRPPSQPPSPEPRRVPEWLRRAREVGLPAKDMTSTVVR